MREPHRTAEAAKGAGDGRRASVRPGACPGGRSEDHASRRPIAASRSGLDPSIGARTRMPQSISPAALAPPRKSAGLFYRLACAASYLGQCGISEFGGVEKVMLCSKLEDQPRDSLACGAISQSSARTMSS